MRQKALDWLYRELKRTRVAFGHAERKPNVDHQELDDLRGKIDLLEYLASLVTKEDAL